MRWADGDSDGPDEIPRPPTKDEAERALADYLVTRHVMGKMTAKEVCVIAYWVKHMGAEGPICDFALKPSSPGGHFARKVRNATNVCKLDSRTQMLSVPGHSPSTMSRVVHEIPFVPVHEALHAEMVSTVGLQEKLAAEVAHGGMPPCYMNHPVAIATGHRAMPISLYVDGVPYTDRDGLLGFWAYNWLTERRQYLGALRKSRVCQCGCRGWCSYWVVFDHLRACFMALALGQFPSSRGDGPWRKDDGVRSSLAGLPMSLCGALVYIKGDWAEYCNTFAFPTWSDLMAPCLFCRCTRANMLNDVAMSPVESAWPAFSPEDYESACAACEVLVTLTEETRALISKALHYDKRRDGGRGRCLRYAIPSLGLRAQDRLEPSDQLRDVGAFDQLAVGTKVVFWRRSKESRSRHRNPLLDASIGITVSTFVVDSLHAVNLGPMKEFCKHCIWELILCDAWGCNAGKTEEEGVILSCMRLKGDLLAWYPERHRQYPTEKLTRVQDLRPSMIGTKDKRILNTKAAETKGLLLFLRDLLPRRGRAMDRSDIWQAAASALVGILNVVAGGNLVMTTAEYQDT